MKKKNPKAKIKDLEFFVLDDVIDVVKAKYKLKKEEKKSGKGNKERI